MAIVSNILPALWPHGPLAAAVALLLVCAHPPGLDWPQHQAVGAILAALWRQEPCALHHYAFHLQPTPYHLLYVVLGPAIYALGSRWGSACTLVAMALATHGALYFWAIKLGRDPRACVVSPLLFFSASFAWGFGPTMMGLPFCMVALAHLAPLYRATSDCADPPLEMAQACLWAGLFGALAITAHGVFLLGLAVALVPLLLWSDHRLRLSACAIFLLWCLPTLPMVVASLLRRGHGGLSFTVPELTFETAATGWNHLRLYFAAFDRGLCRAAQQGLTLISAVGLTVSWRRLKLWERQVALVAVAHLSLVWLVPLNVALTPAPAWLLNVRFLPLFAAAIWLLALPGGRAPRTTQLTMLCACSWLFVAGMALVFVEMQKTAAYIDALQAALPEGTYLPPGGAPTAFGRAWPPIGRHLTSVLVPHPVCVSGNLFVGGHFPIRLAAEPNPQTMP